MILPEIGRHGGLQHKLDKLKFIEGRDHIYVAQCLADIEHTRMVMYSGGEAAFEQQKDTIIAIYERAIGPVAEMYKTGKKISECNTCGGANKAVGVPKHWAYTLFMTLIDYYNTAMIYAAQWQAQRPNQFVQIMPVFEPPKLMEITMIQNEDGQWEQQTNAT
jgi:hypothetical protein